MSGAFEIDENERKALEDYLLAEGNEESAMKAIKSNVQGSAPYFYLYFLHKFKTVGVDGLSEEDLANLDKLANSEKFKDTWQA